MKTKKIYRQLLKRVKLKENAGKNNMHSTKNEIIMFLNKAESAETEMETGKADKEIQIALMNILYGQGHIEDDTRSVILDKIVKGDVV